MSGLLQELAPLALPPDMWRSWTGFSSGLDLDPIAAVALSAKSMARSLTA